MADAPSTAERTHMVPEIPAVRNTDFNRQFVLPTRGASRSNLQGTKLFYGTVQLIKQTARAGFEVIRNKDTGVAGGSFESILVAMRPYCGV